MISSWLCFLQSGKKTVKAVLWVSADGLRVVDDKTKVRKVIMSYLQLFLFFFSFHFYVPYHSVTRRKRTVFVDIKQMGISPAAPGNSLFRQMLSKVKGIWSWENKMSDIISVSVCVRESHDCLLKLLSGA